MAKCSLGRRQLPLHKRRIVFLKQKLAETDYTSAKIAEGSAAIQDYAEAISQRQAWRQEINGLTAE
jgi:hypothetical protein